jgi:putative membrane protein insertion efficiency factor
MGAKGNANLAARAVMAPIRFYRRFLSPLKPPSCRFTPTCSAYALEAVAEHGVTKGIALTLRRLARCHPITWLGGSSGFDPVPHNCNTRHP